MADKLIVGCGYLGRRVALRWRAEGHRVFGTTRSKNKAEELAKLGVEPVVCDVLAPESLHALPAAETVLHCVGFDRGAGHTMRSVYVSGLCHVLAALSTTSRFLYVSSTSIYGQTDGEEVDEQASVHPIDGSGVVVREAEEALRRRVPGAIVLRFAGIYGPGRIPNRREVEKGEPLASAPDRWLNLIHVEDGVAAILAAEGRGQLGQVYNVADDQPVIRRDFYGYLAELLHAPEPSWAQPPIDASLPRHPQANRRILNRRMRAELGVTLQFPSYSEGLPAALASGS